MENLKVIDFSYSDEKTGEDILTFCNEMLSSDSLNHNVKHMLSIIKLQIK